MNIQSTAVRPAYAAQPRPAQSPSQGEQEPPADKFTFAGGVAQGGNFVAGIAGPIAGLKGGFKAGMEASIAFGQYEVGLASLAGAAVGGFVGYQAGQHGPELVGKLGQKLGLSAETSSAVGSFALATAFGGGVMGIYGAGAGAAISLGTGAVQHFRG